KIDVHESRGLAWGSEENLVPELARLNQILCGHPCFFDGATVRQLTPLESPVLALERTSADGQDQVLILINLDEEKPGAVSVPAAASLSQAEPVWDLLTGAEYPIRSHGEKMDLTLAPAEALCLAPALQPRGIPG